jgi:quinol monooxygenase YgiN
MYGTVALCRVKADDVGRLRALMAAEEPSGVDGYLGTDILVSDNHEDTLLMVVRFRDRASYEANADSPGQDAMYRRFRALMQDDPVWYDGEWVAPV